MIDDDSLSIPESKNIYYQRLLTKITNNNYPELSPDKGQYELHCLFLGFRLIDSFPTSNDLAVLRLNSTNLKYVQTQIITIVNKLDRLEIIICV